MITLMLSFVFLFIILMVCHNHYMKLFYFDNIFSYEGSSQLGYKENFILPIKSFFHEFFLEKF